MLARDIQVSFPLVRLAGGGEVVGPHLRPRPAHGPLPAWRRSCLRLLLVRHQVEHLREQPLLRGQQAVPYGNGALGAGPPPEVLALDDDLSGNSGQFPAAVDIGAGEVEAGRQVLGNEGLVGRPGVIDGCSCCSSRPYSGSALRVTMRSSGSSVTIRKTLPAAL